MGPAPNESRDMRNPVALAALPRPPKDQTPIEAGRSRNVTMVNTGKPLLFIGRVPRILAACRRGR